jgi:predicted nucleotidyltransferase
MNDNYLAFYCQNTIRLTLGYFLDYPDRGSYGKELSRNLNLSVGAVHAALTKLHQEGILKREQKGKTLLYFLNEQAAVSRSLKITRTLQNLLGLVKELAPYAREIYLFGSSAAGEYVSGSDIDLAVVTLSADGSQKIEKIVSEYATRRKIQLILFTTLEWEVMEMKDPVFYRRITGGINIYNQQTDELKFQEVS